MFVRRLAYKSEVSLSTIIALGKRSNEVESLRSYRLDAAEKFATGVRVETRAAKSEYC
jgi:hypothetical protein